MRRSITALIFTSILFLCLLSISGVGGFFGEALYFLAFAIPIAFGLIFSAKSTDAGRVAIRKERILPSLALFAPTLLLIIAISAATSYLLALIGKSSSTDVSGNLAIELLRHALLPAVLEELLFRFIPLKLLGERSPRAFILVSSLLFALIHLNLFQIPYAILAGGVFAFLALATGSIIPSILLHLANNALSVIWMRNPDLTVPIIVIISVLSVLSIVYIFIRRREHSSWIREAFSGERIGYCPELVATTVVLIAAAIFNLR